MINNNKNDGNSSLKRDISLLDAVGIGLGAVIGAGIFVVTGVAAGAAGPAFLIGLLIAGFAAACNGLSSAQLASVYPQSGGTYEYGYHILSPWFGFSAGWMFLISKISAGGVVAIGFGSYLSQLVPIISLKVGAVAAVIILTMVNYFGVKKAGLINRIIVSITLLSLIYFVISGIDSYDSTNLQPFAPTGIIGIGEAAALMFFAFTGYARITTLGEEVKEPKNTIPKAVVITLLLSVILYFAVAYIAVAGVGSQALSETSSPLGVAAESFSLPGTVFMISFGATTAMLGVLLSQILGISRMMFAMARKNDLPRIFTKIHSKNNVPHIGILFSGIIIILLTIFGTFKVIVSAAAFSILLYYSITNIAALRMNRVDQLYPKWVPVCGLIACLTLAFSIGAQTIIPGLLLLGIGFILKWLINRL